MQKQEANHDGLPPVFNILIYCALAAAL